MPRIFPLRFLPPDILTKDIFSVMQDAIPGGWNLQTLQNLLIQEQTCGFLAIDGQATVGFIAGQSIADQADILSFAVINTHRKQGIGRELLARFVDHCRDQSVSRIVLDVAQDNIAAIALYHKCGFQTFGRRERYYAGQNGDRKDAVLMELTLVK